MVSFFDPEQLPVAGAVVDPNDYYLKARLSAESIRRYVEHEGYEHSAAKSFGSSYAFSPNESGYMLEMGIGLRGVDREIYLEEIAHRHLVPLVANYHRLPTFIKEYYSQIPSFMEFKAQVESEGSIEDEPFLNLIGQVLVDHDTNFKRLASEVQPTIEAARSIFVANLTKLVETGKLPASALDRLDSATQTEIRLTDELNDDPDLFMGGYFNPVWPAAFIIPFTDEKIFIEEATIHELSHFEAGSRVELGSILSPKFVRSGLYEYEGPNDLPLMGQAENEALTEIVTHLVINPDRSYQEAAKAPGCYTDERKNLYKKYGPFIKELLELYFTSDTPAEPDKFEQARQALVDKINRRHIEIRSIRLKQAALATALVGTALGVGLLVNKKHKKLG